MEQANLKNRTIFCRDNIDVLQGINSNSIDLIYLDPPFNKNKKFTAPIGSSAEGASFKDIFRDEDLKLEWLQTIKEDNDKLFNFLNGVKLIEGEKRLKSKSTSNFCYLSYVAIRLIEMHRILKDTGSIYLHCDSTMSHYIKLLMDIVFGEKNFRNEIIWHYYNKYGAGKKIFGRNYDQIFLYSKSEKYLFILQREKRKEPIKQLLRENIDGVLKNKKDKDGKVMYRWVDDKKKDCVWIIPCLQHANKEYVGYPTQKPIPLLEIIIKTSSNEGDIVLDPFCGCATTCVASEKLNRQWIGIDVSHKAYELVKERLQKEVADPENLLQYQNEIHYSTNPPKRTDTNGDTDLLKKSVYVISHPNYSKDNLYKVGVAFNTKTRLNSYQTGDPDRAYKLEYRLLKSNFRETEIHISQ